MVKQTAVEWLVEQISYTTTNKEIISYHKDISELVNQALEMENERAQEYAEFAIRCDRMGMKILNFDGFIKLKQDESKTD
jgi:hypothetical protein